MRKRRHDRRGAITDAAIIEAIASGTVTAAARALGIERESLHRMMRERGLRRLRLPCGVWLVVRWPRRDD